MRRAKGVKRVSASPLENSEKKQLLGGKDFQIFKCK